MTNRAHDNGPFKEFDFTGWIFDNMKTCREEMQGDYSDKSKFDESFRTHMRSSVKEQLMAVRDVINAAIEKIEEREGPQKQA